MLVIPSYDIDSRQVHLFRTPHSPRLTRDLNIPMVDVALATTAAPTFLPCAFVDSVHLVDGGVWANNPTMVAVTEAGGELQLDLGTVRVLSLGTTSEVKPISDKLATGGLVAWAPAMAQLFLDAQAQTAFNQASHLLGKEDVVRIDPHVAEGEFRLDLAHPDKLRGKAAQASRHFAPEVRARFLDHRASSYQQHVVTSGATTHG
jgi:patatin-like phospholipase/acyl hydrolase